MAAETALKHGEINKYQQLIPQLEDYPLYPYLRYEYLRTRLNKASTDEVAAFINTYDDTPLSSRLHFRWIKKLAQQGRWKEVQQQYKLSKNVTLICYYRRALLHSGDQQAAFDGLQQLWLVGHSQPRECDPLFSAWHKAGFIDDKLAWQRIQLAIGKRKISLARYLTRFLSETERDWANTWIDVHRKPERILTHKRLAKVHPMRTTIIVHGLKRMAHRDPLKAAETWQTIIRPQYDFSDDEVATVERAIAMTMALRNKPEALSWLAVLDEKPADQSVREWRVRTALNQQNWDAALAWLYQLNDEEQQAPRWQYWRARVLEALGEQVESEALYSALAMQRHYYGFLAADKLDLPYRLQHKVRPPDHALSVNIEQHPGILRARELFALDRVIEARREWFFATRYMEDEQLYQAGKLAHEWGWHDRAIHTIARTTHRDDLNIRFPLAHRAQITLKASENSIETALAFALIRQESAFTADARSSAGAMGLMQLMPRTARQLSRGTGIRIKNNMQLADVDTNLKLGMKYLGKVLQRFNHNPVLALAAYNAGQARVQRWIPSEQLVDADLWAETIPFQETRHYIQGIMAFMPIYEQQLGQPLTPLTQRMIPIGTPPPVITKTNSANTRSNSSQTTDKVIKTTKTAKLLPVENNSTAANPNAGQAGSEGKQASEKKDGASGIKTMQYADSITLTESQQPEGI